MRIGITERGDAAIHFGWLRWVLAGKPAILITKNFRLLNKRLKEFNLEEKKLVIHATITGFGGTWVEPGVEKPDIQIAALEESCIPKERLVLRVDPVIPTAKGVATAQRIIDAGSKYVNRVRISFLDGYPHVFRTMPKLRAVYNGEFHAPLATRKWAWVTLGKPEVCAEPGLECSGCVSARDCEIFGIDPTAEIGAQRPCCKCLATKYELLNNVGQCPHKCSYCYWNKKH